MREVDLDFLLLGIFFAETPYGKNDAEVFEFRGIEAVGYGVNISGNVFDLLASSLILLRSRGRNPASSLM